MEENWYNLSKEEVEEKLKTNLESGLTTDQVSESRAKYGYNQLQTQKKKSLFVKFLEQFKDFMIIILIIAAIVSAIIGISQGEGFADSIIIMIVVIANAIIDRLVHHCEIIKIAGHSYRVKDRKIFDEEPETALQNLSY